MNKTYIGGKITQPKFSHISRGVNMYEFTIENERFSGIIDKIPCIANQEIIDSLSDNDKMYGLTGQIHTRNYKRLDGTSACEVRFFAKKFEGCMNYCQNIVELEGNICKTPIYRKTPSGRDICDLLIATNRENGKSDYIPCIVWGAVAVGCANLAVGTRVKGIGRFQSREYLKHYADGTEEVKTAYEVSINKLEVVTNENV